MSTINFNSVTFYYSDSKDKIFEDLSFNIDHTWRLGLIGRNGRGKSTLLKLINNSLAPVKGSVNTELRTFYFPYSPSCIEQTTFNVIKESIAPFAQWENLMKELLKIGDEECLIEYGNILEEYQSADGYEINSMIEKEFSELGMSNELLQRQFTSLSGGEQTRALIVSLFLKKNSFPLIDEPTDHLDMKGRLFLGEYLSKKKGFILASHDRNFLDLSIDHVLSVNKGDVRVNKGNYSQWKYNMEIEEEFENRKNENLKREVKSLESAAKKRRGWAAVKEKEKTGAYDKGYIGHKSAKQMKRALNIEERIIKKLNEKKSLLMNSEDERHLKFEANVKLPGKLLSVSNGAVKFNGKTIFNNFSLDVLKGERVALTGDNGCGKTTLLKALTGEIKLNEGMIYRPAHISISFSEQNPVWDKGMLKAHLQNENIDETQFRNIMGAMGVWGEIFERPLETFSKGQIKKVELCKSFLNPGNILIWDEPLNYLDIYSREQLEEVILKYKPTILFTEHDKTFVENVATRIIRM